MSDIHSPLSSPHPPFPFSSPPPEKDADGENLALRGRRVYGTETQIAKRILIS